MPSSGYELRPADGPGGRAELRLSGRPALADAGRLRAELEASVDAAESGWRLDLSGVEALDGGVAATLVAARRRAEARGLAAELAGAHGPVEQVLSLHLAHVPRESLRRSVPAEGLFDEIGRATLWVFATAVHVLDYLGRVANGVRLAIRRPRSVQWRDVGPLMERSGADAVPIVFLILFLIGLVIAYQSAEQMHRYGADSFVADVIALSIVRELGPLMTAIIVAGRSGAAFAAELGTMQVSEEIDALRTMRLSPIRFLVLPRILALAAMVPLLTLAANLFGILGGLVSALASLDLTFAGYVRGTIDALDPWDLYGGLLKALVFGILIALVSCERGLSTRGGAEGVGRSTTSAVVVCLFNLVVADSVLTILYQRFGV